MFIVKAAAIGFALYAAYAWYQGRHSRVPIALTVSGSAFAFWDVENLGSMAQGFSVLKVAVNQIRPT